MDLGVVNFTTASVYGGIDGGTQRTHGPAVGSEAQEGGRWRHVAKGILHPAEVGLYGHLRPFVTGWPLERGDDR